MTANQTIDGVLVPRKLAESLTKCWFNDDARNELRALLDGPYLSEAQLIAAGLGYPMSKEDAVKAYKASLVPRTDTPSNADCEWCHGCGHDPYGEPCVGCCTPAAQAQCEPRHASTFKLCPRCANNGRSDDCTECQGRVAWYSKPPNKAFTEWYCRNPHEQLTNATVAWMAFKAGRDHASVVSPAEQPAPVTGVLPERLPGDDGVCTESHYASGWNDCLDEVIRLNAWPARPTASIELQYAGYGGAVITQGNYVPHSPRFPAYLAPKMCNCNQGRLPCTCKPSTYDGFDNGVD